MKKTLTIALSQLKFFAGDIEGNCKKILKEIKNQSKNKIDIIIFSELSITGYPIKNLMLRTDIIKKTIKKLKIIKSLSKNIGIVIGHPLLKNKKMYNALSFFWNKKTLATYLKQAISNNIITEEKKYFSQGKKNCILHFKKYKLCFLISKDITCKKIINSLKFLNIDILISINAICYDYKYNNSIIKTIKKTSKKLNTSFIYLNQVGGQDSLIFDGNSKILNKYGKIIYSMKQFEEQTLICKFSNKNPIKNNKKTQKNTLISQIYKALVMSTKDYINRNKFQGALLGLSGGIDSALTLSIAVDAIGNNNILGIMMPSKYTRKISIHDAKKQATLLGIKFKIISIKKIYTYFINLLKKSSLKIKKNITKKNLQARCRCIILMSISNETGYLVLNTTNKSELSTGYTTIYGDMSGGFAVLKDIPKTIIFKLMKYRNQISKICPKRIIQRAPSAELSYNQKDQDDLPPYKLLDKILKEYVENNKSINEIIKKGFNSNITKNIIKLVDTNEYKRQQAPIGPSITKKNLNK